MRKTHQTLRRLPLLGVATIIAGVVFLVGGARSSKSKSADVTISNKAQTCRVISATKLDRAITLLLTNDSAKNITAYVISFPTRRGDVFTVKEEFAYSEIDFVIGPGRTYKSTVDIPFRINSQETIDLQLSAVIFDDKSSEGDQQVVRGIEDERSGERLQFQGCASKKLPTVAFSLFLAHYLTTAQ
jgi:hypothetical protein